MYCCMLRWQDSVFSRLNDPYDCCPVFTLSFNIVLVLICSLEPSRGHIIAISRVLALVCFVSSCFLHFPRLATVPVFSTPLFQTFLAFLWVFHEGPRCVWARPALQPECRGWLSCRSDWIGRRRVLAAVPPHPWRRNDNISLFYSPFFFSVSVVFCVSISSFCHWPSLPLSPCFLIGFSLHPPVQTSKRGLAVHLCLWMFIHLSLLLPFATFVILFPQFSQARPSPLPSAFPHYTINILWNTMKCYLTKPLPLLGKQRAQPEAVKHVIR